MASDQRDWYRDWWRKRTGYVERSRFRMSEAEFQEAQRTAGWRRVFGLVGVLLVVLIAAAVAKKWPW